MIKKILLKFPFGHCFLFCLLLTICALEIYDMHNFLDFLLPLTLILFLCFWTLRPFRKYHDNLNIEIKKKKFFLFIDIIFYIIIPFTIFYILFQFNKNIKDGDMTNMGLDIILYFLIFISFLINWIIKYFFLKFK
jgi:hypothetical protein